MGFFTPLKIQNKLHNTSLSSTFEGEKPDVENMTQIKTHIFNFLLELSAMVSLSML